MPERNIDEIFRDGLRRHQAGRLAQAGALYQQVLARQPAHADALHLLGVIAHQFGQNESAVNLIGKAIALKPNYPQALCNLGNILRETGQVDQAIAACRRAVALKPDLPEAHCNLGNAMQDKGCQDEAIECYRSAIARKPNYPEAYSNLGASLREDKQLDEAIAACRRAIALRPNFAEAYSNLGICLHVNQQLDEAIDAYRRAIDLLPNLPEPHYNLGTALRDKGLLDDAMAALRHSITLRPNYAQAHHRLAMLLLQQGDFAQGWKELEWRWACPDFPAPCWNFDRPLWDGSDPAGRTILVHAEQGFGDTIQFIRYVPLLAQRGATVICGCDPALRRLLRNTAGISAWVDWAQPLPAYDFHCPMMSLPLAFGTTPRRIPDSVPYVKADDEAARRWQAALAGDGPGLKVGLAWAGRPTHQNDRARSASLAALAPLARAKGVIFHSLQKGDAAEQTTRPPAGMTLFDRTAKLHDFADTAALIANLDLVITVDTVVAHLAGAMGRPVWVLLPFVSDWRWFVDREDSPWYPTMRLFRQTNRGDWGAAIERAAETLSRLAQNT